MILSSFKRPDSIVDVEDIWRTQWGGKLCFAHSSNHSCGVMILVISDLDFNSAQELLVVMARAAPL